MHISPLIYTEKIRGMVLVLAGVLMLGACSSSPIIPAPLLPPKPISVADTSIGSKPLSQDTTEFLQAPATAPMQEKMGNAPTGVQSLRADPAFKANINIESLPLPQFAQAIFGEILKQSVSIDQKVMERKELISLRSGKSQNAEQIFSAARAVLQSFGITVSHFNGLVRVVPNAIENSANPEIYRGTSPEAPVASRPVFAWTTVDYVKASEVRDLVKSIIGDKVVFTDDRPNNALLISGQSDLVNNALEVIRLFDQPSMRGRHVVRINPVYWSADQLTRSLSELLLTQGFNVGMFNSAANPIFLLPISQINSIFVFANRKEVLDHALRWARELDQPSQRGNSSNFISYALRNADASAVATTLAKVLGGNTSADGKTVVSSKVVVNEATNSLIIKATGSESQELFNLLRELDRPPRSALVSATIAEVRLTDTNSYGFNWLLSQFSKGGFLVDVATATAGSLGSTPAGLNVRLSRSAGDPRVLLNALASENKINILSNPSIITRSGESASISVGQEVPILTSQVTNSTTNGIQQTVQYRSTGVNLTIKPIVHSSGRIDVDVSQEVSVPQSTTTGVTDTPTILSRKINTKLTVADGVPTLMGGLISNSNSFGNAGIPLLKDIPILGKLFTTSGSQTTERVELVLLLTVYSIEDAFEAQAITEAFRNQLSWARDENASTMGLPSRAPLTDSQPVGMEVAPLEKPADSALNRQHRRYELPEIPDIVPNAPPAESAPAPDTQHLLELPEGFERLEPKAPPAKVEKINSSKAQKESKASASGPTNEGAKANPASAPASVEKPADSSSSNKPAKPISPEEFLKNLLKNAKPVTDPALKKELENAGKK